MSEFGIVVAVGPEGVGDATLDFVAAEALRRGTGVELLHVIHALVAMPASIEQVQAIDVAITKVGREVLTAAALALRPRLGGRVPLNTEILTGPVVATLADHADFADLIVLERRDAGRLERMLTMSISARVAAHTHAPVVVVPRSWTGDLDPDLPVTVGADEPLEALHQVETAQDYAAASGRPMLVLHAAWLAEPYQGPVLASYPRTEWIADADRELATGLEKLAEQPGAKVDREVQWARPVDMLVEATRHSAVLVLNRRPGEHPLGGHLGQVTRTVLRHAECPVMVVDRT
ncbi:universal stress protein [Nocardioides endophyticus]|uniref:Universal stress protein n=1 Tax=Nocardioides endophyticus TaxID=1353775 RepID=A0ABP8Z1R9_9ACTN